MHPAIYRHEFFNDLMRSVGGCVVDDDHVLDLEKIGLAPTVLPFYEMATFRTSERR